MPQPDACRILEAMFPGLTVQRLFQPVQESRDQLQAVVTFETHDSSEQISCHELDDSIIGAIEAGSNTRTIQSELAGTGSPGAITAYPMRGLISRPKWNDTIRDCKEDLWLYGMAELGYALDDEVPRILNSAAQAGCDIRILLLDPEYHGIADIDTDEGSPQGTLASRIRAALARFQQISKACSGQMRIRVYNAPPAVSIVRGDDRMLVTPYLRFFVGSNSPSLELQYTTRVGEMFDRYTRHFHRTWDLAKDYTE